MAITETMNAHLAKGEMLAESKWSKGANNYLDGLTGVDRTFTAVMLENTQKYLAGQAGVPGGILHETIRATNVSNFDRFAFPLVRGVYPNLVAQDLVSVQPMDGPVGLVFYFDVVYGSTKGNIKAGTPALSSLTGNPGYDGYGHSAIESEVIATTSSNWDSGGAGTGTLAWTPVVPGSITITCGANTATDDGAGGFTGQVSAGQIDYTTGIISAFQFSPAVGNGLPVVVSYEYDNEANEDIPELDFQITSSPVVAEIAKLRTRYSLEAAQNLQNLHGLAAVTEMTVAMAQQLRFEIDRRIIKDVNNIAQAESVSWPLAPSSTAISYTEHKLSIYDQLIRAGNNVFERTKRGMANWCVGGLEVSTVIESLPGFVPSAQLSTPVGVIYAGTINGRYKFYKDPYNIDGTSDQKNFLVGYKGGSFYEAGYVYAPYIPFYTTPLVVLDDMMGRKAMATQYGKKKVNGNFYCKGTLTGSFVP